MKIEENNSKCIVIENSRESKGVHTLKLWFPYQTLPKFIAGQYLIVYFPDLNTPEGKAYSLSSAPHNDHYSITVKAMGKFSNRLASMKKGDSLIVKAPYGFFYSESKESPLVLIAGGIGITPFHSMILDILKKNPERKIYLMYSNKTSNSIVFKKEFNYLKALHSNFKVKYFLTREEETPPHIICGRMTAKTILAVAKPIADTEFLICGSIAFTRDLWRDLCSSGIPEESILTEAFF